jgi:hypothetical protein
MAIGVVLVRHRGGQDRGNGRPSYQPLRSLEGHQRFETAIGQYKSVIGDALRSLTDETEATEVGIATAALNRMLAFGRPNNVRIAPSPMTNLDTRSI